MQWHGTVDEAQEKMNLGTVILCQKSAGIVSVSETSGAPLAMTSVATTIAIYPDVIRLTGQLSRGQARCWFVDHFVVTSERVMLTQLSSPVRSMPPKSAPRQSWSVGVPRWRKRSQLVRRRARLRAGRLGAGFAGLR
jgi:hypothetical protein